MQNSLFTVVHDSLLAHLRGDNELLWTLGEAVGFANSSSEQEPRARLMWQATIESGEGGRLRKIRVLRGGHGASFGAVISAWKDDQAFRQMFSAALRELPFNAFRWECPPLVIGNIEREFECVALQSAGLDRPADASDFAEFLLATPESVVCFPNLGRDAFLIVPRPLAPNDSFAHLAAFLRTAAPAQIDELWRHVGIELSGRLSDKPIWLNTAGAGVPWLHVRLDSRPKYYSYRPFTYFPPGQR